MSVPTDHAVTLSPLEFDVIWEHLGLGPFPTVYRLLGHGWTYDERAQLVRQAWEGLEARGVGGPVSLDPDLVELLRVLARPAREVDARLTYGSVVTRALAGSVGEVGVIGVLREGRFTIAPVTPGGLIRSVVGLLPDHPPGTGHSVSLSERSFGEACAAGDARGMRAALQERGMRPGDAEQLAEALDGIVGAGQFGAARLDRWGRRHRAPYVAAFVDSAAGRYLLESRPGLGGAELWTTVAPTDPVRLAGRVDRLHAELEYQLDL
ncbi:MAG TPA: ESX secretion-associated protein EspG [Pseudonocardiaceae bacterium]